MKIEKDGKDTVRIEASTTELEILNNALNEVCNGIEVPEFETRVGCSLEDAIKLLTIINAALQSDEVKA